MPSTDDSRSLREEIVHRWKAELFSPDTAVALIAVLIAIPAGLLAAWLLDPMLIYPVWFAVAVGPTLSDISGGIDDITRGETIRIGLALAVGHLAVVVALFYAATAAGGSDGVAVAVSVVGALVVGNVAIRRWLGDRATIA